MFRKSFFKRLVIKLKVWHSRYQDWKYGIEVTNYYYRRLKLGEILKDGDMLHEGMESLPLIIGSPRSKIKAGTVIDEHILSFNPTRKEFINGAKNI